MSVTEVSIPATDGFMLGGSIFVPDPATDNGSVVLISAAVGVKRGYYARYAQYLADEGFLAVTYDYRGIGDSLNGRLRDSDATMRDWGEKDLAGTIAWARGHYPGRKLLLVGHSVGGQIAGLAANSNQVAGLLAVASQNIYWGYWDMPQRLGILFLFYVTIPLGTVLMPYFPSTRLGLGENLPTGVARHWSMWGRQRDCIIGVYGEAVRARYRAFRAPVRVYSLDDDRLLAPRRSVAALLTTYYVNAPGEHVHLVPADYGVKAIGHFGFFRGKFKEVLWPDTAHWLRQQATAE